MTEMRHAIISTGNEELDIRLGGGFPHPNLILIEGDHGSGKSALGQQFLYGALKRGLRGLVVATEVTPRELIRSMKEIQLVDADKFYMFGQLRILTLHLKRFEWRRQLGRLILPTLAEYLEKNGKRFDIALIDSLTQLLTYANTSTVLNFMKRLRLLTSVGKSVILTMHPNAVEHTLASKIRGMCDGYIKVRNEAIGGRILKVMSIVKMRGMPPGAETSITFDVDPAMGIKIVPIKAAKA